MSSMRNMLSGGAPVPPSQVAQMRAKAKKVTAGQGYGLTETMAFGTAITGVDFLKHPQSCGRPFPLIVEIEMKDPVTGKKVKDGERGEVPIRAGDGLGNLGCQGRLQSHCWAFPACNSYSDSDSDSDSDSAIPMLL
jgi:acyl-CoA synthetase (AMP-forming)/AMP-acid ligase II